mgnify:CR=1 FL=1
MKFKKNNTIYGILIIISIWYIFYFTISSNIIPAPHKTIINFIKIFPSTLSIHISVSLMRLLLALLISLFLGVVIGVILGLNKKVDRLIKPVIYILYPIPKVAFLPVFMVLFGLGNLSKVILILFIIIFQVIVTVRDAVNSLSKELFYSVRSLGMNKIQILRHLIIPATMPEIFTSLKINVGTSVAVLFFAENYATSYGIGYFIMNSWVKVNYLDMFSGILALSILGLALFKTVDFFENQFCGWIKKG